MAGHHRRRRRRGRQVPAARATSTLARRAAGPGVVVPRPGLALRARTCRTPCCTTLFATRFGISDSDSRATSERCEEGFEAAFGSGPTRPAATPTSSARWLGFEIGETGQRTTSRRPAGAARRGERPPRRVPRARSPSGRRWCCCWRTCTGPTRRRSLARRGRLACCATHRAGGRDGPTDAARAAPALGRRTRLPHPPLARTALAPGDPRSCSARSCSAPTRAARRSATSSSTAPRATRSTSRSW